MGAPWVCGHGAWVWPWARESCGESGEPRAPSFICPPIVPPPPTDPSRRPQRVCCPPYLQIISRALTRRRTCRTMAPTAGDDLGVGSRAGPWNRRRRGHTIVGRQRRRQRRRAPHSSQRPHASAGPYGGPYGGPPLSAVGHAFGIRLLFARVAKDHRAKAHRAKAHRAKAHQAFAHHSFAQAAFFFAAGAAENILSTSSMTE